MRRNPEEPVKHVARRDRSPEIVMMRTTRADVTRTTRRPRRGTALLIVLFLLVLFEMFGMALLRSVEIDVRSARDRMQAVRARHYAEGAFEVLAARRSLEAGVQEVRIDAATIRVSVSASGGERTLEIVGLTIAEGEVTIAVEVAPVEGRLRPREGGGWRLEKRFY
jgi:hypothetical protein